MELDNNTYNKLVNEIRQLVNQTKHQIVYNINTELLYTYWQIGRLIVAKEHDKQYDESSIRQLLINLSKDLTRELGKGFSRSQLTYMRLFYLRFQTFPEKTMFGVTLSHHDRNVIKSSGLTVSHQLSWSHYFELLKCNSNEEISFYQQSAIREKWSVRGLRRQIDSALFERIALSKNSKEIMELAKKGTVIEKETDIIRDPYILEFLNIPESQQYNEKQLEQQITDNLQKFILELGKGFAFVGRQYRIILDNTPFYVDLVFYHRNKKILQNKLKELLDK